MLLPDVRLTLTQRLLFASFEMYPALVLLLVGGLEVRISRT